MYAVSIGSATSTLGGVVGYDRPGRRVGELDEDWRLDGFDASRRRADDVEDTVDVEDTAAASRGRGACCGRGARGGRAPGSLRAPAAPRRLWPGDDYRDATVIGLP